MTQYRERLWVPLSWWLLLTGLTGSIWLIYQHAYGPHVSLPIAVCVFGAGAAALFLYGRLRIAVDDSGITVGRARLPAVAIGSVEGLTGDAARRALGPELHPEAHLALRGYLPALVRIGVGENADPTPYWLVSTRHLERLVEALEAVRAHDSSE